MHDRASCHETKSISKYLEAKRESHQKPALNCQAKSK